MMTGAFRLTTARVGTPGQVPCSVRSERLGMTVVAPILLPLAPTGATLIYATLIDSRDSRMHSYDFGERH